jgi:putative membrane protein
MLLSSNDRERIQQAVREAETRTRGEIVCVVAEEASDYSEVPLIWAAAIALAAPSIPLTFMSIVISVRQVFQGWEATEWVSAQSLVQGMAMLATMQFGLFVAVTLLAFIPSVRRFLTPGSLKRRYVRQRAFEQFIGKGLAGTKDRAGVLIYASLQDRCAELIADKGIDAKVEPGAWDKVVVKLVGEIRAGRSTDGFVTAIRDCGDHLARHFPAQTPNPNELPDSVTELPQRLVT